MVSIYDFLNVYSVLGCAAVLLWYYSQSTYKFWKKLNVKYFEPVPFLGNTAKVLFQITSLHEGYHKFYKELAGEPYGGIYMIRQPQLIVKDPELVSDILIKDFKNFQDRGAKLELNKNKKLNPLNQSLFNTGGERWRVLRQRIGPVFTPGKLKLMHDQILQCVDSLIQYVDQRLEGGCKDMALKELFQKLTIDVIGSCAFGIDCNSLKSNEEFSRMGREVFKPRPWNAAVRMLLATISRRLLNWLKITDFRKDVSDFFVNLTLGTIEYRRRNGVTRPDLLQLLMELQNSHVDPKFAVDDMGKKVLSEEFDEIDIIANSFLFFAAGFETTASTLSNCLYELALNQDIQERLRSEVQQIKDKCQNQALTFENLREMAYLDAVINEALRKYPPGVLLTRMCTEDYTIPGTKTVIPVGTNVIIPVWSIHHDWKYYSNPEVFDPERFMGDRKHSRLTSIFLPFGEGPRFCLGKRFADMEIKAAISEMILKYDFKPCEKTEIPLKFKKGSLVLQTTCGTWINLSKRKY